MTKAISIGLVDDHVLLRKGLATLLSERDFDVSLQADNGRDFIQALGTGQPPEVLLLDINMPVMDGYATAQWMKTNHPETKILALSVYDDENSIIRMLHCGARGYILKDCEPDELSRAIRSVAERGYYHSELVSSKLIHSLQLQNNGGASPNSSHVELTQKETQFLRLICSEKTYKEIASEMRLSPRTIDGYRDMLFEKLGIKSRVGLVLFAIKNRLVQV